MNVPKVAVVLNGRGIERILTVEARPHIVRLADRIAASATALARDPGGVPVRMRRENDDTGSKRFRAAIITEHPMQAGRRIGSQALAAALEVADL